MKKLLYFAIVSFLAVSCYWDSEEYLYPELGSGCDTTAAITYSVGVTNLLKGNCLSCHSASAAANLGGNIKLDSYANVKTYADNGQLLGSVRHESGYSQMPKGSTKLSDCQIAVIEKWISGGSLNN
jgi:mono/diheme cytochrome c family protein